MEYCWIWMYFTGMLLGFWSLFSKLSSHCIWTCCRPTWPTTTHTILFLLTAHPKIQQTVIFLVLAVVWHLYFICSLEQFVSRSRPVSYTHHWSQWKTHNGNRSSHPGGAVQVWLCQFSSSSRGCRCAAQTTHQPCAHFRKVGGWELVFTILQAIFVVIEDVFLF